MWQKFEVEIQMRNRIVGGIPKSEEMIKGWLQSRGLEDLEESTKEEMADQLTEGQWQGFKKDDDGLYIEARQVKAMLKEAANIIRHIIKFKGPMRARLAERLFVTPDHISLSCEEPTDCFERPIHVMTRLGPRTALKRCDFVEKAKLVFDLWLLNDGKITGGQLAQLFQYAGEAGLGADRSQGEGKFDVLKLEDCGERAAIGKED